MKAFLDSYRGELINEIGGIDPVEFLKFIDLLVDVVLFLQIHVRIVVNAGLQLGNFCLLVSNLTLNIFLELHRLMAEAVDIQTRYRIVSGKRFLQKRLQSLVVARRFVTKNLI